MRIKLPVVLLLIFLANISQAQWLQQTNPATNSLYDVFFVDANTGGAVGVAGTILRTTDGGANWTTQTCPGGNLFGVCFTNANTGIAVGEGIIYRTTNGGANWINVTLPAPGLLFGVTFADANTGFIAGSAGDIFRTTDAGASWAALNSGVSGTLEKPSFANSNTGLVVGLSGVILRTTDSGNNWIPQSSGVTSVLRSVSCVRPDTAYVVGDGALVLKTTNGGAIWNIQNPGVANDLYSVSFSNGITGSAVGYLVVLRTTNGGLNWISQDPGVNAGYNAVNFVNGSTGWAVGGYIIHTVTGGFPYPSPPNLISPANGAVNVPLMPLLDWDTSFSSKTYELQLASDNSFTNLLIDSTNMDSTQIQVTAGKLLNNVTYYWRARGLNPAGYGQWSNVFHFATVVALPNAPTLLTPVNNASNVSLTPFFDWDSASPAIYYRLQVSADSTFSTVFAVNITGLTFSSYTLVSPPLQSNTRYYWRVNATNFAGTSPWSSVFRFTTIITIPQAPILLSPPNNSGNVSLTPTLDWTDDITAISYEVQLTTDSTFNNISVFDSSVTLSQLAVRSGLLVNLVKYFWRVRTTNSLGTGPWCSPWNFLTGLVPPAAPVLIAPPNGDTDVSTILTFDWNDVFYAQSYRIQISQDSTFTMTLINAGPLTISQYTNTGNPLDNNTLYYWRVNAANTAGTGNWSPTWHFRTVISAPIAAPDLLSPANGSLVQTLTPVLDWNDVFQATDYKIQVSTDSLFTSPVVDTNVVPSQLTIPSGKLTGSSTYYWRVRSHNVGGYGPWSVVWNFTTSAIGIIQLSSVIPKDFKLYDNFPNPFNPSTKIRFDLSRSSRVKIEVYDLIGRRITSLVDLSLNAGSYETIWNAPNLPSGVYIYRIETQYYVKAKKMVLIK